MNNNKMKILSIIVLLLFAGLFALPFSTHASCDMCDMAGDACCESMTECTVMPFQPVNSAPLNKVDLQKNSMVDYNISYTDNFNLIEELSFLQVIDKLCSSEVHPGFQTPLLV